MFLYKNVHRRRLSVLLVVLSLFLPAISFATLGENEVSVQGDQAQMRASLRTTRASTHSVHELQTAAGHVIREYVSPSGTVFGVAWQGPSKPDLKQLLGSHFEKLRQEAPATRASRGPIIIRQPGIVFEMSGHMRAFAGRAYIPQLLPAGVAPEAIR